VKVRIEMTDAKTLEEYEKEWGEKPRCPFCGGYLGALEYYPHPNGWEVEGFSEKQWLYRTCLECGHQWSQKYAKRIARLGGLSLR
jgi:hypothetical protein